MRNSFSENESETNYNLTKVIEQNLKTRVKSVISGWELFNVIYSCCYNKDNRQRIINNSIQYIDYCSEIGNIVKKYREIAFMKQILLKKTQKALEILPSINIKTQQKSNSNNLACDCDDKIEDTSCEYLNQLHEAVENLKNIDLHNRENMILAKNLLASLI